MTENNSTAPAGGDPRPVVVSTPDVIDQTGSVTWKWDTPPEDVPPVREQGMDTLAGGSAVGDEGDEWSPPVTPSPVSVAIPPCRNAELRPADPRMAGWRLYDVRRGGRHAHHYHLDETTKSIELRWQWFGLSDDTEFSVNRCHDGTLRRAWYPEQLVWENPSTGELRFCEAEPLTKWTDPWEADNERIETEIARRSTCTCAAAEYADLGLGWCTCNLPGWSYSDSFWTETIKPLPAGAARRRTLPAQYPAGTWRNRVRGWWWRMTHRVIDAEVAEQPALPAAEPTTNPRTSKPADTEGDSK